MSKKTALIVYNNDMQNSKKGFHLIRRVDKNGDVFFICHILINPNNPKLGYSKAKSIHVEQVGGKKGPAVMRAEAEMLAREVYAKEKVSAFPVNDLKKYLLDFWSDDSAYFLNKAAEGRPRTPNHLSQARARIKKYFLPWAELRGITRLDELTKKLVLDWRAWALELVKSKGYQAHIVNECKINVSLALDFAVLMDDLDFNVLSIFKQKINTPKNIREPFTLEEMKIMVSTPWPDDRFRVAAWLAFETGVRFGELQGLTWDHVDLENLKIDIVQQYQETFGRAVCDPKFNSKRFNIPISIELKKELELLRKVSKHPFSKFVFPLSNVYPLSRFIFMKGLKDGLASCGIEKAKRTWHCFRHSYVSELRSEQGIEFASKAVGHSNLEVTRIYDAPTVKDEQRARETVLSFGLKGVAK